MALSDALVDFVKQGLERGMPRAQIEDALLRAGWPADQVRLALAGFADLDFPIPVPRPPSTVSSREAFMYVVMFTTLVVSAYSLGNLVFELINRALPDPAQPTFGISTLQAIRWSLASVIVAFPVFLYVAWVIERDVRAHPIKRASRIRKRLTYVTLFIASCVLIGDVITVVYNFLGGELTLRFLLKVVTVAAIAGSVFGYYLRDLRAGESEPET
jgi:hypothetical protein